MVVPVFIAECSPTPIRGRILIILQFATVLGDFSSDVLVYILGRNWRASLGLGMVPALVQGIGIFFLSESPRWLLKTGQDELATSSFKRVYNIDSEQAQEELGSELFELRLQIE